MPDYTTKKLQKELAEIKAGSKAAIEAQTGSLRCVLVHKHTADVFRSEH